MKSMMAFLLMVSVSAAQAAEKIKMNFTNEEITKILQTYSKATGQRFIIDPGVRGKVSILQSEPVTPEEAFNELSTALALNGFAISKQGDTMVVRSARNVQRDLVEVSQERPGLKPERMYTWLYTAKNLPVDSINRELRILSSKDGEMSVYSNTNQLIITDWVSNINRVAEILKELDRPMDPAVAKVVDAARKERDAEHKTRMSKRDPKGPKKEEIEE